MAVSGWVEKLGRAMFESPFAPLDVRQETPELAEVRLALLEEAKSKSHRVSGRPVFPYNRVCVRLRGVSEQQSAMLSSGFFAAFCERELRDSLDRAGCRFPDDLHVDVETSPELPGPKQRWLSVIAESRAKAAPPRKTGRLLVLRGAANAQELLLTKARTNIGRTAEIYRADGPSRRNDLAFTEGGDVNRTVSREHAHIMYLRTAGEYRLFNDRSSASGVWIMRDGLSRAVHRDTRGVKLRHGDEIHLGRAVLRFVLK
ncbi:MAG TPA: FHA domain-containing protein [Bryobacteraceae bacterium]|nr:FHA domain-containing protein [Bryobacteraceae bacterium]